MILQGLPDFQQPVQGDGLQIFYPFEGRGNFVLIPDRLAIAERKDGRPDFMLELVRGKDLYGVLDFRLRPRYRIDRRWRYSASRTRMRCLMARSFPPASCASNRWVMPTQSPRTSSSRSHWLGMALGSGGSSSRCRVTPP